MKDRIAGAPGRYSAVVTGGEYQKLLSGQPFAITMTRDDEPVVEGTPYNKAAVLPDNLATLLCPGVEDPTPADALGALQVNKAPAGYGLGEAHGRYCSDCHAFAEGGFYYVDINTANNPAAGSGSLFIQPIVASNGADFYLTLKSGAIIWHCYYSSFAKAWQPWECENPPMEIGVEYRTTERHDGKAVYAIRLDFGYLPDSSSKGATTPVLVDMAAAVVVGVSGHFVDDMGTTGGELFGLKEIVGHNTNICADKISLSITTDGDVSEFKAYPVIKYTKD